MKVHQVKFLPHSGTDFREIYPQARKIYNKIKGQTKRQPYIRSKYFKKEKVFIELFWVHLNQKNRKERNQRLKLYGCGIELLRNTVQEPVIKLNPNKSGEILYRFAGLTANQELFYIQIKEHKRTRKKDLVSIFPAD